MDWWSVTRTAALLGISRKHVYDLLHSGQLYGMETDVGWLVDPEAVEHWASEREVARKERPFGKRRVRLHVASDMGE